MWVGVGQYTSITQYLNTYWLSPSILLLAMLYLVLISYLLFLALSPFVLFHCTWYISSHACSHVLPPDYHAGSRVWQGSSMCASFQIN